MISLKRCLLKVQHISSHCDTRLTLFCGQTLLMLVLTGDEALLSSPSHPEQIHGGQTGPPQTDLFRRRVVRDTDLTHKQKVLKNMHGKGHFDHSIA